MFPESKINNILDNNTELYNPTPLNAFDQSRLVVSLDQNIIDDINKQIETKQKILENDPIIETFNNIFVNIIDVFYGLIKWIASPFTVNLFDVIFTDYRPTSIVIFIIICYYTIKIISNLTNWNQN